jgi:hypothetical protein
MKKKLIQAEDNIHVTFVYPEDLHDSAGNEISFEEYLDFLDEPYRREGANIFPSLGRCAMPRLNLTPEGSEELERQLKEASSILHSQLMNGEFRL